MLRARLFLAVAIALEVVGTLSLRVADGFQEPWWSALVVASYATSIVVFAQALRLGLGLGVAYATLTATGLTAAALASTVLFDERLGAPEVVGLICLVAGVVLLQERGPGS